MNHVRITGILVITILAFVVAPVMGQSPERAVRKPNFVIVFVDDVGYGDLGCFGSETIKTPRLDRMAVEGTRLTSFYSQTVCGPARGALLTGRYPVRIGGGWETRGEEVTLAEILVGEYATGCIGKWDISRRRYQDGLVPNDQGFQYYFGTLGANDNGAVILYRNREKLETTRDMASLTERYTDEALQFMEKHRDEPFFLYVAHTMAHVVVDASDRFKGNSRGDLYGDVIEEIDWNTGRILDKLNALGLSENTYVLFTSDNGPWNNKEAAYRRSHGGKLATGSAGPLRSGKGSPMEGGFREPCIFWGPGRVPAGRVSDAMMSTLDILPTFAKLAGARHVTPDSFLDGSDESPFITGEAETTTRDRFFYHVKNELQAVRFGTWKLHLPNRTQVYAFVDDPPVLAPVLYDLSMDIGETKDVAARHPEIVRKMLSMTDDIPSVAAPLRIPAKDKFHLFLLAGQSNMAGRGKVDIQGRQTNLRVLMLNNNGVWVPAIDPLHFDKPGVIGVGLGKSFALEIAKSDPEITIGLIPCAAGGSPIETWQPGGYHSQTRSHPWDDAIRRAEVAMESGTLKGILWHQGESDSNPERSSVYEDKLHDLVARFRAEFEVPDLPFIAGQMGQFPERPWTEHRRHVDSAHRTLPQKLARTAFVGSDGLTHKGDEVHFDTRSYRELGRRYARAYLDID